MNKAIKCGYEFGLNENNKEEESFGKYVYQKYIEIVQEDLKDELNGKEAKNLVNGFFLWR